MLEAGTEGLNPSFNLAVSSFSAHFCPKMQLGENDHSRVGSSGARSPPDWGFLAAEPPHAQPKCRGLRAVEKQKVSVYANVKILPEQPPMRYAG